MNIIFSAHRTLDTHYDTTDCNENSPIDQDLGTENARIYASLIQHYRNVGFGNMMPGLRFLHNDTPLTGLTRAAHAVQVRNLERCRALWALAKSYIDMLRFPTLKIPIRITIEQVQRSLVDEAALNHLETILTEQQRTLHEYARELKKSPVTQPGSRLAEANLLFWEGLYLIARATQFCFEVLRPSSSVEGGTADSAPHEDFGDIYAIARRSTEFCVRCLTTKVVLADLRGEVDRVEKIYASLERHDRSRIRDQTKQAEMLLPLVCGAAVHGIAGIAKERLRMAEAIYRRLGFMEGVREVYYNRALLDRWLSSEGIAIESSLWMEEITNGTALSRNLGAHLEAMHAHIMEAVWASDHDLNRAGRAVASAIEWANRLRLPATQRADLGILLTAYLGNAYQSPVSIDEQIDVAEKAAELFDSLTSPAEYISASTFASRRLSLRWWISNFYISKSKTEADGTYFLEKARLELDTQIRDAQGPDFKNELHSALRLRGMVYKIARQFACAYEDYETALEYYLADGNKSDAIAVANSLVGLAFESSDDRMWMAQREKAVKRISTLEKLALEMLKEKEPLNGIGFLRLSNGCRTLALFCDGPNKVNRSLVWYERAFDALLRIHLAGTAILLDEAMRPLYLNLRPESCDALTAQKARVLSAAPLLDRSREQVDFVKIARIVRAYTESATSTGTVFKDKRQFLDSGKAALGESNLNVEASIEALEKASNLITDSCPEDIDLEILASLRLAYLRNGDGETAGNTEQRLNQRKSLMESRNFLELAEYYRSDGRDYTWALEIAVHVMIPNEFSQRAQELLNGLQIFPQPAGGIQVVAHRTARTKDDGEEASMNAPLPLH